MFKQRQGLIVWLNNLKKARQLRKYGNVHYVSKRLKYAVLYCDQEESKYIMEKLQRLPYVKKVELSYRPFLRTDFDRSKPEKHEEYDYKIGF